jgi:hypothetical protein
MAQRWLRPYRERCGSLESDPRQWVARPPADGDGCFMMSRFSACTWEVTQDERGIRARVATPEKVSLTLPVSVDTHPQWEIARCGSDLSRRESDPPLDVKDYLRLETGVLVAYDSGEWGGALLWFDGQGKLRQRIAHENTRRLLRVGTGIFAFSYRMEFLRSEGYVRRLVRDHAGWRIAKRKLPGVPFVVARGGEDSILVLMDEGLAEITADFHVRLLHHGDWRGLYPSSITEDADGTFFVGMRYTVARLRPNGAGYAEEWLVPPDA